MPEFISATADIRGDCHYSLTRVWDSVFPTITFVLLNLSTADAEQLDPTLRRCVGFAKRNGYGDIVILNLYAFRTKAPRVMSTAAHPVGPKNDSVLAGVSGTVIAGWGTNADPALLRGYGAAASTSLVGRCKRCPWHPLDVRADAPLVERLP